jgi:hypothetical protein
MSVASLLFSSEKYRSFTVVGAEIAFFVLGVCDVYDAGDEPVGFA